MTIRSRSTAGAGVETASVEALRTTNREVDAAPNGLVAKHDRYPLLPHAFPAKFHRNFDAARQLSCGSCGHYFLFRAFHKLPLNQRTICSFSPSANDHR